MLTAGIFPLTVFCKNGDITNPELSGGKMPDAGRNMIGTVAKLAMRQPFVLFKGLTFQKLCLPGAFRPGDHHNRGQFGYRKLLYVTVIFCTPELW
ncbi:hypothetical protein EB316_22530 [Salmonella enterica]|nr:hypothetical protein [Salmonella enterica]EBZ1306285.1 hypothetical protein [Salmonella enterica subsp. enterica serovar Enteritidis]EAN6239900.1 hypothetical protein [Salmonella enterica]EBZ1306734.1 hypothetical protein [Salmonella enterica subsp. enterica serovar Enteritidis]ECU3228627.1 hypothetical protein [Salmonella enterica subsp. enterica serovar Enteritidis]